MVKRAKLSDEDRDFFDLVSRAAFCNPFGEERAELDQKITGCPADTPHDECIDWTIRRVQERVLRLAGNGEADLRLYSAQDRQNLQAAFMFDIFHRVADRFDALIQDQIQLGQVPSPVPFARETLVMFSERGFSFPESIRFFAMLYQIRRAFYFINRSLIGSSPSMRNLRLHLWNNVFTHDICWYEQYLWNRMEDFSTLLLGETGTGKGTAAAAIGRSGFIPYDEKRGCFTESFTRNFIAINLSQFAESLIESELFGHKKGAFTGAVEHHDGVFTRCTPYGSIFLDEVGDISVPIQVKLLQVLEDRTFMPVGSHRQLRFSGRVIAATNRPLDEHRRKGQFREDLFYRLCSDVIVVPPLRQRLREEPKELDRMIAHVVGRLIGEDSEELIQMVREVIGSELGLGYPWPGNVRELEQAVRRILLTKRIGPDSGKNISRDCVPCLFCQTENGAMSARELLEKYCLLLYERFGNYEEVSRRTQLDRRTVKKYILQGQKVRQDGFESPTEEPG